MAELPFLVVHGGVIAKLVVAIPTITTLAAIAWVRRIRDARAAAQQVREHAARVTAPAAGEVTVRGIYRILGEERWIDAGGERIELLSTPAVLRGSRARWSWRRDAPTHTLADGDEVIAHGTLAREADGSADAAASYRSSAGTWVFSPASRIEMIATRPATRPRPIHPGILVFSAGVIAAVSWFALGVIGKAVLPGARSIDDLRTASAPGGLDRIVVAAALPGREDALRALETLYDRGLPNTRESDELRLALARVHSGCSSEARLLGTMTRYEEELALARSCGDDALAFEALLFLGRYGEAAALGNEHTASAYERGLAAIGAGRWADAAAAVDAVVALTRSGGNIVNDADNAAEDLTCVGMLFRVHAGEAAAANELRAAAKTRPTCAVIEALSRPLAEQAAALDAVLPTLPADHRLHFTIETLRWSAGRAPERDENLFSQIAAPLEHIGSTEEPWLAPSALPLREAISTRAWLVVLDELRGDFAAAHAEAARVRDKVSDASGYDDALALDIGIALRAGEPLHGSTPLPARLHPAIEEAAAIREGRDPPDAHQSFATFESACESLVGPAFTAIQRGDGGPIADVLEQCTVHWIRAPALLIAALPRITANRDHLVRAVRLFRESFGTSTLSVPFAFVGDAALHRDLARLADDPAGARAWQGIIDAHAKALADRDRVIAMILWHTL